MGVGISQKSQNVKRRTCNIITKKLIVAAMIFEGVYTKFLT